MNKEPLTLLLSKYRSLSRHLQSAFGPLSALTPENSQETIPPVFVEVQRDKPDANNARQHHKELKDVLGE